MLELIKRIISPAADPDESSRKAEIAACVILLEAALADNECSPEEMNRILATIRERFSPAETDEIIALARAERDEAVDLWQFTNLINQEYTLERKLAIMVAAWRVILADGKLAALEDHFAHKLANLLRLNHKQLIEAKLAARDNSTSLN